MQTFHPPVRSPGRRVLCINSPVERLNPRVECLNPRVQRLHRAVKCLNWVRLWRLSRADGRGKTAECPQDRVRRVRSSPAVLRGAPAQTANLDAEKPFAYEVHQAPVEGGAVRLMAERHANVIAVKDFGELRQGRP